MRKLSIAVAAIATLALVATDDAWSARGGRGGRASVSGRFAGGGASRAGFAFSRPAPLPSGFAQPHHHHGRTVIFVGSPFLFWSWPYGYYYAPPPYYYGPDYVARETLPPVYVEKFDGTPTPQTPGEIYCPDKQAYYPDVQDCSNGWQRIIREPQAQPGSG
jgi:hypothetical protein